MSNAAKKQNEKEAASMTVVKNDDPETVEAKVIDPEPELTLEEKIQRVEDLTILIDKRRKLIDSRRSLQTFRISADGLSNQLTLHDLTSNSEFRTFNAAVISRVLDVIRNSVDEKLAEIEAQIRF